MKFPCFKIFLAVLTITILVIANNANAEGAAPAGGSYFGGGGMLAPTTTALDGGNADGISGNTSQGGADLSAPGALKAGDEGDSAIELPQVLTGKKSKALTKKQAATLQAAEEANAETGDEMVPQSARRTSRKTALANGLAGGKKRASPIERALIESPTGSDKPESHDFKVGSLSQFGYNYFNPEASFAALSDVPVGPDYVIGTGDRFSLTVWGSFDGSFNLQVNRSGEVILPKVGPVKVSGVQFGKLQPLLAGHLAKVFKDFHISVTMGKLRLMKVYLVGEVNSPGDYSISSLSTVINALAAADGPTKNGSLRSIQIKRDGKTVEIVDLYDFFTKGDKNCDIRLQPGDTIFVPNIGPVAGITGNVRRPAIYELKGEKTLKDLIALAGGITSSGYLHRLQVSRIEAHDKKIVTDLNIDPKSSGKSLEDVAATLMLQDMDLVKIFPIDGMLRNYVRIDGYVLRPGDYALRPGMRLSQLLADASLLPEYYTEAGQIDRLFPPDNHHEIVNFNVNKALAGDPAHDLVLNEFDRIEVYSRWSMEEIPKVKIGGEVQKPGEYRLYANMKLRDLIIKAGNPRNTAFLKNAEIVRLSRSGESVSTFSLNVNLEEALKGVEKDNILLQPFDEVVIRRIPNWKEEADSYVTLKGQFVFPGIYPVSKGEKLSSVISRAGGFTDKAYLHAAKFTRQELRVLQQQRMDEALVREEANIAQKQASLAAVAVKKDELDATMASLQGLQRSIAILKSKKAEGRMIIHLTADDKFKGSEYDFELLAGDALEVPSDPKSIMVIGKVYNPTAYHHVSGATVTDYLQKSGGFTREAEESDIYVLKADGSVSSRQMASSGFLFFGGFMNQSLTSGDTLVVPQVIEKTAWLREIKDVTTILGQIALMAGVLIAAGL